MKSFFIVLAAALSFAACKKDKVTPLKITDGTYTGLLLSSNGGATNRAATQLVISGKNYNAASNTLSPATSRGSFVVGNNQVTFNDSTMHPANFDWGLLLSGTYNSTSKGDSLILVKKGTGFYYIYRLKKQ